MVQQRLPKKSSVTTYLLGALLLVGVLAFGIVGIQTLSALSILGAVLCAIALVAFAYGATKGGRKTPVIRGR